MQFGRRQNVELSTAGSVKKNTVKTAVVLSAYRICQVQLRKTLSLFSFSVKPFSSFAINVHVELAFIDKFCIKQVKTSNMSRIGKV